MAELTKAALQFGNLLSDLHLKWSTNATGRKFLQKAIDKTTIIS